MSSSDTCPFIYIAELKYLHLVIDLNHSDEMPPLRACPSRSGPAWSFWKIQTLSDTTLRPNISRFLMSHVFYGVELDVWVGPESAESSFCHFLCRPARPHRPMASELAPVCGPLPCTVCSSSRYVILPPSPAPPPPPSLRLHHNNLPLFVTRDACSVRARRGFCFYI